MAAATAVVGLALAGPVLAQVWPERPIRLIIASAPGGTVDIIGRLIEQNLARLIKASGLKVE